MRLADLKARIAKQFGRRTRRALRTVAAATGAAILAGGMMFAGPARAVVLLQENFESLSLGPFVSTSEGGGDDTDWTDVPPENWTRDNTTTPEGGPAEFFGWTFLDKNSWDATSGQGRGDFTLGQGTVAVADGDEYDDDAGMGAVLGGDQSMNVFLMTPEISLDGVIPSSVQLDFDSSFFPYDVQTGVVDVSFDGGSIWNNLLTLDSAALGNSSAARKNESVNLNLGAQTGDTSAMIRFGYLNADNDWWWAIDNILISDGLVEGDVNQDGVADLSDYAIIRDHMFFTGVEITDGDLDRNNIVNFLDFRIWKDSTFPAAAVPEPASSILIGIGFATLLGFRRRRTS